MPLQEFHYRDGNLHCEGVSLDEIAASVDTPTYVYSAAAIRNNYRAYDDALAAVPHDVRYSVKANSCLAVLALVAREGGSFDIVSGGELFRVRQTGAPASSVVFSGVGKTRHEIREAIAEGIGAFHCESVQELEVLRHEAEQMDAQPAVALRVNPNIDAKTHPYIATGLNEHKFGIAWEEAEAIYRDGASWNPLRFTGLSCHIGSQISDLSAFQDALRQMLGLATRLRQDGVPLDVIDLGGGLAVDYEAGRNGTSIEEFCAMLEAEWPRNGTVLALEPGRSIVGRAGVLLTKVLYRKSTVSKSFVVVDAAMNDLMRPSLYNAHHEVLRVLESDGPQVLSDIVGPVCESGDFLAKARLIPDCRAGDIFAVATAGAYGFVLSSNYNSRRRAAEVLVNGESFRIVRARETREDLIRGETL